MALLFAFLRLNRAIETSLLRRAAGERVRERVREGVRELGSERGNEIIRE